MSKGLTSKTIGSVLWASAGTGVQFLCNVAVITILARLLRPADFGLIAAATAVVSFGEALTRLGVTQAIVQQPVIERRHIESSFWYSTALGAGLVLLVLALAPQVARAFQIDGLTPVLRVLSVVLLLRSISAVGEALIQRNLKFKYIANVQIWSYVAAYTPVGIGLAIAGWGVWSLVYATLARAFIEMVLFLYFSKHSMRPRVNVKALREVLTAGRGIMVNKFANQFATHADNLIVARVMGASALGLYSRAYRLMSLPANLFGEAVERVAFPAMAKVQHEPERLQRAFVRSAALVASVAIPLGAICCLLGPEIIGVFLGDQWGEAVLPFQVLAFGIYFRLGYKTSGSLARATGNVFKLARLKIAYAVVVTVGALVGAQFGLAGVAVGIVLALAFHFVTLLGLSLRHLSVPWGAFLWIYKPASFVTACVAAACWATIMLTRSQALPEFVTLIAGGAVSLLVGVICLAFMPAILNVESLAWWTKRARGAIRGAINRAGTSAT